MSSQLVFYVFFAAAAAVACMSAIRLYQNGMYKPGLVIRNGQMRRKQDVYSVALGNQKLLVDRKQEAVDALVRGDDGPNRRREIKEADRAFGIQRAAFAEERRRIDADTAERMEEYQRWRRIARSTDSVLLTLSVAAMVVLYTIDIAN
jgi:hypothetical protein